jgi:hypothetical protein
MVVDAELGDVAGVVADGDGASDEWRQGGREVALALKVDTVALHNAVLRDGEEEPVEFFEGVGHAWKPAVSDPGIPG